VLPVASFLECPDLVVGVNMPYLQLQEKVMEPLYESKGDFRIAAELGRKMGFEEEFDQSEEEYIQELISSDHPMMEGVTIERLKEGPVRQNPPKGPAFRTPTGRIEFYAEKLSQFGQQLPVYLEPLESVRQPKAKTYPLSLITPHARYRIHSTLANLPQLAKFDPEPLLEIHPADAEVRGIGDGDPVLLLNDRGQVKVKARLTRTLKQGVVTLTQGRWPEHYIEGHHNQLTHETVNPAQQAILGPNAALCDVLVEVRRAE
jgi:molybdopterin-containing oxidoreductase family molybdopterin binding subunit